MIGVKCPRTLCKYSDIAVTPSQYSSISAALLTEPFMKNNKPKKNSWRFYLKINSTSDFWSTCSCELWVQMWRQNSINCLQISLFYDFQNDAHDNSIPHKRRSRLHSEAQFHIKRFRFPLYKQHSIDATIIFWVIRHLGVFTWNTRSYLFFILRNTRTALI